MSRLDLDSLETPIVQAGMGGIARHELAAAVSEAGGHVRGTLPLAELLERVRAAVAIPVLAAGGIVDAEGVRAALDAGAAAAVVGTRFLLSDECRAHPGYKQRCLDGERHRAHRAVRPRLAGSARTG